MIRVQRVVCATAFAFALVPARPAAPADLPSIDLSAASSLRDALPDLAAACGHDLGAKVVLNFGASNELARQIESANKADVFFSADEAWMDHVAGQGLVDRTSRISLLTNRLVVIAPAESKLTAATARDLSNPAVRRIAIANTESVPAGRYAKAWLQAEGVWEPVRERVIPMLDVRAALAAVESGTVDLAVVYRTDALNRPRAKILFEVSESHSPRISYSIAAIAGRPQLDLARRLVACLSSDAAKAAYRSNGFLTQD